jgi:glycosyltransferase involved in cell wall biosynthesis
MNPASSASIDRASPAPHRNFSVEHATADRSVGIGSPVVGSGTVNDTNPVAIVIADLCTTGGMDMANFALADYLARQHRSLHLVAHRVDAKLTRLPTVAVHRAARPLNSNLLGEPFLNFTGKRVARQLQKKNGRVIVNGGNCTWGDVNWIHYVHAAYRARSAANLIWRAKNDFAYAVFVRGERRNLKIARTVIANSRRTRDDLIRYVGVEEDRIHVVYYGSNPVFVPPTETQKRSAREKFGWNHARPLVVFVGALGDRRKGFDTLFAAWKSLCRTSDWDADLVVVGLGVEMPVWKQRAADAGLADRFHFLGFRSDVPEILAACDCLVAPTRYEAYGLGVQEALCTGLPAIVSADAGVAERYPESLQSLLLADCEDPVKLSSTLVNWREQQTQLRMATIAFGDTLRLRTWDHMAADIEQLLDSV